ncbi:DegT/DnrJ/EryC1/StrS family aminotransferase [Fervidobacterium nodosum]|uniref:DegT/DnrJ/EryC1/StrS aminotransferase n=1 Tax=Fervidobacterium nodosum (strain ATCC 35602 / DSM 5306 / Rt17-B1) TaxID=381764 RepID=A7HKT7_FERNB|nr:DegT/DnrJ/EryC1/StrS family aminotransferase [Fervidobacterium nodosum]ABS60520.1 DegT/DnrJ/EryC1/StrS aminotransferase [Fervidobacterium nodosum Rt17-B1]
MKKVPLSSPQINSSDIEVVVEVLKSGRLSIGKYTEEFENSIRDFVGAKYAVAVSSGTSALHLILKASGFTEKSLLIVPSFTFVASANVALFEKGSVEFVDIEPDTLNTDSSHLEEVINKNSEKYENIYFMGVDVFGHPLEWDRIEAICNKYGVKIIEDSCEALGSEYKGKKAGSFGIAGAFAFYANKQITTGEGGIIVTNDEDIYKISKSLRNQGRGEGEGWLAHEYVGYNYRIDEMSAALGWSQMKRIDDIIGKRDKVAQRYNYLLSNLEVKTPVVKEYVTKMSWFVYVVQLPESVNRQKRKKIMEYLENNGIQVRNYFEPVHLQKPYRELGWKEGMLPITESVAERTLALPFYTDLIQEDQEYVVEKLKEALEIFA